MTVHLAPQFNVVRIYAYDITERKRAEEALRESEQRVRLKLNSILSPEGDIGNLELGDIIDAPAIQSLMEKFYELTHIPLAVIDLKGKVLVGVGWQEICTKFHRVHPETCGYCIESDTLLTAGHARGRVQTVQVQEQHVGRRDAHRGGRQDISAIFLPDSSSLMTNRLITNSSGRRRSSTALMSRNISRRWTRYRGSAGQPLIRSWASS